MATSKGVEIGSSRRDVMLAYQSATRDVHGYLIVPVASHVVCMIGLDKGVVTELVLTSDHQDCFG